MDGVAEVELVAVTAGEVVRMVGIVESVVVVVVVVTVALVVVVVIGGGGARKAFLHSCSKTARTSVDSCSANTGIKSVGKPIFFSAGLCRTSRSRLALA